MLIAAVICFTLAVLLGLILFSYVIQGKPIPRALALTHGPLALAGIILLIVYAYMNGHGPIASIVIFIIAALGGLMMFYKDITGKPVPSTIAIAHGALAFLGFIVLVIYFVTT